jgi:predicted house-cleaning noncanonical NTP pyrophosphatase (MazG superfamily)/5'-deoxynucleotidase YfbR-like HD superfamily hydrolase
MHITPNIRKAMQIASKLHKGQLRKSDEQPFFVHPFSVAAIVAEHTTDENTIIAGIYHDTLEDVPGYTYAQLAKDANETVAQIVAQVSEQKFPRGEHDKRRTWRERKEFYIANLEKASQEALIVSAADKIHNLSSMLDSYKEKGDAIWRYFNGSPKDTEWFLASVITILLDRLKNPIVNDLLETYEKAAPRLFNSLSPFKTVVYHKLVRDKIPEIIEKEGKEPITGVLDQRSFLLALLDKVCEEAKEVQHAGGSPHELMKEIGDVEEVLDALVETFGLDRDTIKTIREKRKETRGGFAKKILLERINTPKE